MICIQCQTPLTRPSPLTERSGMCRICRRNIKMEEQARMKILSIEQCNEPIYEKDTIMPITETIVHEPPDKITGQLAELKMEKTPQGIYMNFNSPMLQQFMLNTLNPTGWSVESTSNITIGNPGTPPSNYNAGYLYGWRPEFQQQYKKIATLSAGKPLIDSAGVISLGFFYIANKKQGVDPHSGNYANVTDFIDPTKPIEFLYNGVHTNDQLDEYIAKVKEVMYRIYSENMAAYNKRLIITFTEEQDEKQAS